jgi:hypothetical protein
LHQTTVPGDIGAENGGELAVKAFLFHAGTSLARRFGKFKMSEENLKKDPSGKLRSEPLN